MRIEGVPFPSDTQCAGKAKPVPVLWEPSLSRSSISCLSSSSTISSKGWLSSRASSKQCARVAHWFEACVPVSKGEGIEGTIPH